MQGQGFEFDPSTYDMLIEASAKQGDMSAADAWLRQGMEAGFEPTLKTFNALASGAAKIGDMEAAEMWFEEAVEAGISPDETMYQALISASSQRGGITAAEHWFGAAVKAGIEPNLSTLDAFARASLGNMDPSEERDEMPDDIDILGTADEFVQESESAPTTADWFSERGPVELDLGTYNELIVAAAEKGDVSIAEFWFRQGAHAGFKPTQDALRVFITRSRQGAAKAAERLFRLAPSIGFNALIEVVAQSGNLPAAERLLRRAEALQVVPDGETFASLISAAAKVGNFRAAEQWLEDAKVVGIKVGPAAYAGALRAAAARRNLLMGRQWLERAIASGVGPVDLGVSAGIFYALFGEAKRVGDSGATAYWLEQFELVIEAVAKKGDLVDGLDWCAGSERRSLMFNSLINAATAAGDAAAAERWYNRAGAVGVQPSGTVHAGLISLAGKNGDPVAAKMWFERAVAAGVKPSAAMYTSVIDALRSTGDVEGAESWFTSTAGCTAPAEGFAKAADRWLEQALEAGMRSNETLFSSLVSSNARRDDLAAAERWLKAAETEGQTSTEPYTELILLHVRRGDMQPAEAVFQRMLDAGLEPDVHCWGALIRGYSEKGNLLAAVAKVDAMERKNLKPSPFIYIQLLKACSRTKPPQGQFAERFLNEMQENGLVPPKGALMYLRKTVGASRFAELWPPRQRAVSQGTSRQTQGSWRWTGNKPIALRGRKSKSAQPQRTPAKSTRKA